MGWTGRVADSRADGADRRAPAGWRRLAGVVAVGLAAVLVLGACSSAGGEEPEGGAQGVTSTTPPTTGAPATSEPTTAAPTTAAPTTA
ncbi:MAG TPA: hypothetical protein VG846_11850, partial [Actinomycetota bacterium]|nr:hypothetical protein [Actinomycetota bacterium]